MVLGVWTGRGVEIGSEGLSDIRPPNRSGVLRQTLPRPPAALVANARTRRYDCRVRCDLHIHTHRSDGAHPTLEVLNRARRAGLDVISITDHDTIDAYDEIEPDTLGPVALIHGIELTTGLPSGEELHILGYFPRGFTERFRQFLEKAQSERRERMRIGVGRLAALGHAISMDDVLAQCKGRVINRSHLAQALVDRKIAASYPDAFRRFVGFQCHIIPPPELPPARAIELIRCERGLSIWAHPTPVQIERWLAQLARAGLNGMEVYIRRSNETLQAQLEQSAADSKLLRAGGSDWHGHDPHDPLGSYSVPAERIRQFLSFFPHASRQ